MNNSIRQSWKIFNNLKFYPKGKLEEQAPRTKKEAALWAEKMWNHIVEDELKRHIIFVRRGKGTDKYTITVWSDSDNVYLIVCNRTEFNTDSTAVYLKEYSETNLQDFINLAKFVHKNITGITNHSIKAYTEMQKLLDQSEVINGKA